MGKIVKLGEIANYKTGKLNSNAAVSGGKYPFFTCSRETYRTNTYSFDCECVLLAGNNANAEYPVKYFNGKFDAYQRTYVITPKDLKQLNIRFLFYAIELKLNLLKSLSTGSATRFLTKGILDNLEFDLPLLLTQQKIVSILSSYDDLIENNNRRIAILEEMARNLYREWFVKFRFSGHEEVKMVDSELGQIPEGWEVKKLHEISYLTMGQSPKSEFYNEDQDGLPFFQGVADFGGRFPSNRIYCNKATRFASKGDILFSVRAPVGRLNFAHEDLAIGRGLAAIQSNSGRQNFLFLQLKTIFYKDDVMGNGAIFNSVTKDDIQQIQILMPVSVILDLFESKVNAISKLLDNLYTKNNNLKSQRDMLLPKLISGKIKV